MHIVMAVAELLLLFSMLVLIAYAVRHYAFSLARVCLDGRPDVSELAGYYMPRISVLIPMHNEEKVAADVLQALVECDYDWTRLEVLAIDDRSTDGTPAILDEFAQRYSIIKALHRTSGNGGKPGALQYATDHASGEILMLFDADYIPGRAILKQLVAPFSDAEVGATMGRVVPRNVGDSLLAGMLSLERAAGYQVGQEARHQLGLTPQFGGTVGGVRASALRAVGGWNRESLTEDTDLTCRLVLNGWRVAYVNRAECYEEVPHTWPERRKQLTRWVMGHTECLHRYFWPVLLSRRMGLAQKVDVLFMLACYLTAPVMLLAWVASMVILFGSGITGLLAIQVVTFFAGYQLFANQATFFEIGSAAFLDGSGSTRILLLPANLLNFFASTGAICTALTRFYGRRLLGLGTGHWHKTARAGRNGNGNGNGNGNSNGNGNGGGPAPGPVTGGKLNLPLQRASNGLYF